MKYMHSCAKLENIKRVGVTLRPSTPELKDYYLELKETFENEDIEVLLENAGSKFIGLKEGVPLDTLCEKCDILISVGGDGTLISLVRRSYPYKKPILGINLGNLGFLTDIRRDEIDNFAKNYHKDVYRVDCRLMFECIIENDEANKHYAFNDVVLTRHHLTKMVHIKALFEENHFNTYYGDGIIISSPTGSTAYNISAGGPLIYPYSKTFVITPICPHSLFQRPLVLPADFEVEFEMMDKKGGVAMLDGQDVIEIQEGQRVKIRAIPEGAKLIHRTERDYFKVLKDKFNWGDA